MTPTTKRFFRQYFLEQLAGEADRLVVRAAVVLAVAPHAVVARLIAHAVVVHVAAVPVVVAAVAVAVVVEEVKSNVFSSP